MYMQRKKGENKARLKRHNDANIWPWLFKENHFHESSVWQFLTDTEWFFLFCSYTIRSKPFNKKLFCSSVCCVVEANQKKKKDAEGKNDNVFKRYDILVYCVICFWGDFFSFLPFIVVCAKRQQSRVPFFISKIFFCCKIKTICISNKHIKHDSDNNILIQQHIQFFSVHRFYSGAAF